MNRLITFEGIDGSGKSTQIQLLAQQLDDLGLPYVSVREPGGTRISELIRHILLSPEHEELASNAESLLFLAARAQVTAEIILPALQLDHYVICDRYTDSTVAYQGFGRQLDAGQMKQLNDYATCYTIPGLTFLIDIDVEASIQRRNRDEDDRMESGGYEFMERIRKGYLQLAAESPHRFSVVNGMRNVEEIHEEIWNLFHKKYVGRG